MLHICISIFIRDVPAVEQVYDSVLLHYTPENIARELTIIDRGLIIRIDFDDLLQHMNLTSTEQVISNMRVNIFINKPGEPLIKID